MQSTPPSPIPGGTIPRIQFPAMPSTASLAQDANNSSASLLRPETGGSTAQLAHPPGSAQGHRLRKMSSFLRVEVPRQLQKMLQDVVIVPANSTAIEQNVLDAAGHAHFFNKSDVKKRYTHLKRENSQRPDDEQKNDQALYFDAVLDSLRQTSYSTYKAMAISSGHGPAMASVKAAANAVALPFVKAARAVTPQSVLAARAAKKRRNEMQADLQEQLAAKSERQREKTAADTNPQDETPSENRLFNDEQRQAIDAAVLGNLPESDRARLNSLAQTATKQGTTAAAAAMTPETRRSLEAYQRASIDMYQKIRLMMPEVVESEETSHEDPDGAAG